MPVTKNTIVQHFSDRFLNLEKGKELNSISEILNLPFSALKDTTAQEIESLAKNNIKTIRDLGQINPESIGDLANNAKLDPARLKKFFIASKLIGRAWQKRSTYAKKTTLKIVVVGLDNAGKTTLIDLLAGKKLSEVINQTPTTMVNQVTLPAQDVNLVAWDFGGQVQHRETYLHNPEEYFVGLDLVLFVIDMQDAARFEEALGYFSQLLDIILYMKETPYFLVLMHKSDPELLGGPDFQIHLEYVEGKVRNLMSKSKLGLELVKSSIYSTFNAQPQIVGVLKDMFKSNQVTDVNVLLLDAMMKLTDLVTQIGNKMVELEEKIQMQVSNLEVKLTASPKPSGTTSIPAVEKSSKTTPPPAPPKEIPKIDLASKDIPGRSEIMSELKEMFKKKGLTRETD